MIERIKELISLRPAPFHGMVYDLVEYGTYHTIRLYRDNFEEFSESQRLALSEWLSDIIKIARLSDIPLYLEVFDHASNQGSRRQ